MQKFKTQKNAKMRNNSTTMRFEKPPLWKPLLWLRRGMTWTAGAARIWDLQVAGCGRGRAVNNWRMRDCFAGSRKIFTAGAARICKLQGFDSALEGTGAIDQTLPARLLKNKKIKLRKHIFSTQMSGMKYVSHTGLLQELFAWPATSSTAAADPADHDNTDNSTRDARWFLINSCDGEGVFMLSFVCLIWELLGFLPSLLGALQLELCKYGFN